MSGGGHDLDEFGFPTSLAYGKESSQTLDDFGFPVAVNYPQNGDGTPQKFSPMNSSQHFAPMTSNPFEYHEDSQINTPPTPAPAVSQADPFSDLGFETAAAKLSAMNVVKRLTLEKPRPTTTASKLMSAYRRTRQAAEPVPAWPLYDTTSPPNIATAAVTRKPPDARKSPSRDPSTIAATQAGDRGSCDLETEIVSIKLERDKAESSLDTAQLRSQALEAGLEASRADTSALRSVVDSFKMSPQDLNVKELENLRIQIAETNEKMASDQEAFTVELKAARTAVARGAAAAKSNEVILKDHAVKLESDLDSTRSALVAAKSEVESTTKESSSARTRESALDTELSSIKAAFTDSQTSVMELRSKLEYQTKQETVASAERQILIENIAGLKAKLESAQSALVTATSELKVNTVELSSTRADSSSLGNKFNFTKSALSDAQSSITELTLRLESSQSQADLQLSELKIHNEGLSQRVTELEKEDTLQTQNSREAEAKNKVEEASSKSLKALEASKDEIAALKQEIGLTTTTISEQEEFHLIALSSLQEAHAKELTSAKNTALQVAAEKEANTRTSTKKVEVAALSEAHAAVLSERQASHGEELGELAKELKAARMEAVQLNKQAKTAKSSLEAVEKDMAASKEALRVAQKADRKATEMLNFANIARATAAAEHAEEVLRVRVENEVLRTNKKKLESTHAAAVAELLDNHNAVRAHASAQQAFSQAEKDVAVAHASALQIKVENLERELTQSESRVAQETSGGEFQQEHSSLSACEGNGDNSSNAGDESYVGKIAENGGKDQEDLLSEANAAGGVAKESEKDQEDTVNMLFPGSLDDRYKQLEALVQLQMNLDVVDDHTGYDDSTEANTLDIPVEDIKAENTKLRQELASSLREGLAYKKALEHALSVAASSDSEDHEPGGSRFSSQARDLSSRTLAAAKAFKNAAKTKAVQAVKSGKHPSPTRPRSATSDNEKLASGTGRYMWDSAVTSLPRPESTSSTQSLSKA